MTLKRPHFTTSIIALMGAVTLQTPVVHASATPVENLLSFFGNTCTARDGSFTKAALTKAQVLAETLASMKSDPDCKALSAAAIQAQAISENLRILQEMNSDQLAYIPQEQALLTAIASSTDPTLSTNLQDLYLKLQSTKDLTKHEQRAQAARNLVIQSNELVNQAINQKNCLMRKPSILATLGSLVSQAGAAASLVNPAIGLGTSVGGTMLSNLVNLAREFKYAKEIRKLQNDTLKPEALSCVMESLSNDYCKARDALLAIDWKLERQQQQKYPVQHAAYALRLVERDIPAFTNWLITLRASGLSQNTADASRVVDFNDREALYRSSPWVVSGVIEQDRFTLEPLTDPVKQWPVFKSIIQNIVYRLSGGPNGNGNPLFQKYSINEAMFYLIGFPASELPPRTPGGQPYDFNSYNPNVADSNLPRPPGGVQYDLRKVQDRFDNWFRDTADLVNNDRSRILQPDEQLALENAFRTEQGPERISPYSAISNIVLFLKHQLASFPNAPESRFLLQNTIDRLEAIQKALDSIHLPPVPNKNVLPGDTGHKFIQTLSEIYDLSELDHGIIFMRDRLTSHADTALVRYLTQNASTIERNVLAQTLASRRMTELLLQSNTNSDLGAIRDDINNSVTITLPSLQQFVSFFERDIRDVLVRLREQEQAAGPYMGLSFKDKRAKICLLLSQNVSWPQSVPQELCTGSQLKLLPGAPSSPTLNLEFLKKDPYLRACSLYELRRETLIYQTRNQYQ